MGRGAGVRQGKKQAEHQEAGPLEDPGILKSSFFFVVGTLLRCDLYTIHFSLPPLLSLPPQVFILSLSAPPSPSVSLHLFGTVLCLCQPQPLLDTAACFLSPFPCLHLSLSPSALACLFSSVCRSVCLLPYYPPCS